MLIFERDFVFRCSDLNIGSNNNVNYLGIGLLLELVSKYDTFLSTHKEDYITK